MASEERLRELEDKYEGYTVYDNRGDKIGKVDDLFVDEADNEEYIGVKMGFLGRKSTLIPTEIVRVNEADRRVEVSESKNNVKNAPSFDDDEDITPDYEERIRSHFGLGASESSGRRGSYGAYSGSSSAGGEARENERYSDEEDRAHEDPSDADTTYGERTEETGDDSSTSGASSSGTSAAGTAASADFSRGSSSGRDEGGTTGSSPVTRETEETETYEEGGRTKIRRRIVREEIIEEDA
ncbi:MAG TPA: PRC-barrel domain-containing protein [Rubrobacteraceae bacterium]|nr:PRC-barrel domain-containing protein [Rubrobacteraceae bacterium]